MKNVAHETADALLALSQHDPCKPIKDLIAELWAELDRSIDSEGVAYSLSHEQEGIVRQIEDANEALTECERNNP